MLPFQKLRAWQACHLLTLAVYRATKTFPDGEKYGLTSQSRRAASSAAANIAEGSASRTRRDFCRFLSYSIKSLREPAYWFILARDLELLDRAAWQKLEKLRTGASLLTWRLYQSLRK